MCCLACFVGNHPANTAPQCCDLVVMLTSNSFLSQIAMTPHQTVSVLTLGGKLHASVFLNSIIDLDITVYPSFMRASF